MVRLEDDPGSGFLFVFFSNSSGVYIPSGEKGNSLQRYANIFQPQP